MGGPATIKPSRGKKSRVNFITNLCGVVVMEMWIRSPKTQTVGAWIGFTAIDRDHGLMREPTPVTLKAGWNHVKRTLPYPKTIDEWSTPWVGTFIPLLGTTDHPQEVPGLEYSCEPKE